VTGVEAVVLAELAPDEASRRLDECALAARPVVLVGAAAGLRAVGRWTPAYLRRVAGGVGVGVRPPSAAPGPDAGVGRAPLAELLDALEGASSSAPSFAGDDDMLFDRHGRENEALRRALEGDWEPPRWVPSSSLLSVGLWFAKGPDWGPLHYDGNGAACASAQVYGRRRVRLYAPDEAPRLYPHLATALGPAHLSRVDLNRPDLESFPRFGEATYVEAELAPGDLLVTPPLWFKSNLGDEPFGVHLNFWWQVPSLRLDVTSFRWALARELGRALMGGATAGSAGEMRERARALGPDVLRFLTELEWSILANFGREFNQGEGFRGGAAAERPATDERAKEEDA
jgi:cupin-like protein